MIQVSASTVLRAARRSGGIAQRELAERAGTSQPDVSHVEQGRRSPTVDTFERLLNATGHKLIAVKTSRQDAVDISAQIACDLMVEDVQAVIHRFLEYSDGLAASSGVERVLLAAAEPYPCGSRVWDAALAAVAEYWLDEGRLPKPDWLGCPARSLPAPQALAVSVDDVPPRIEDVPEQFLRRNLLVARGTFASD